MDIAIIGHNYSKYTKEMIEKLTSNEIALKYIIIQDSCVENLAESAYYIDNELIDAVLSGSWSIKEKNEQESIIAICIEKKIPFFIVDDQNSFYVSKILRYWIVDVLLLTDGPIIRGDILSLPHLCALNLHPAPLPWFRGNWATRLALYHDYPPLVSAHVVTNEVDGGAIIDTMRYNVYENDTASDIDDRAWQACKSLAVSVLQDMACNGLRAKKQRKWEGTEYKGYHQEGIFYPAMTESMQRELDKRLQNNEYGFYSKRETQK